MSESRTLKVDPHLIFDVISKQAGTLGKSILEGVMNSVDAGASRCDITLVDHAFTIADDGKGFASRDEIEKFFETFGTPHKTGDATYGRFRIGRGQMFSFGRNRWRSGAFSMAVDLRNRGLDYDLRETPEAVERGCCIEVALYDRLSPGDLDATVREVKELIAFAPIPVTLNGSVVTKDRAGITWAHEDDDCLIAFRTSSATLKVYNLGMLVRSYPAAQVGGAGGIVVSKRQLEVNFARNDILATQCDVWKRVRKVLDRYGRERTGRTTARVTNDHRQYQLRQWLGGDMDFTEFRAQRLFPAFPSGYTTFSALLRACLYGSKPLVVLEAGDSDRIAEAVVRADLAVVLRPEVLDWCGVGSTDELIAALRRGAELACAPQHVTRTFDRLSFKALRDVSHGFSTTHALLPSKDLTPLERAALKALETSMDAMLRAMRDEFGHALSQRALRLGRSDTAWAWTDGSSYIGIDRAFLKRCIGSLAGVGELVGTMVHEYIHDCDDTGSHVHDADFYERFHELMLGGALHAQRQFLRNFYASLRAHRVSVPAALRRDLDVLFRLSDPVAADTVDDADAGGADDVGARLAA